MEGTLKKSVAVSLMGSSLPAKVGERVEGMFVVEELLVFSVAAFPPCHCYGVCKVGWLRMPAKNAFSFCSKTDRRQLTRFEKNPG